jgi:sentrin-specific protease 8
MAAAAAASAESPVLSYHAAVLYEEDLLLLLPKRWLNDAVLTFWAEFLSIDRFSDTDQIAFLHPSVVLMTALEDDPDDLADALKGLELSKRALILLPINDSDDVARPATGSHWTLLLFRRTAVGEDAPAGFSHLDSGEGGSRSANFKVARRVAGKIAPLLGSAVDATVAQRACAKQTNGYDCGVHVLWNMEQAAHQFMQTVGGRTTDAETYGATAAGSRPGDLAAYRTQILDTARKISRDM